MRIFYAAHVVLLSLCLALSTHAAPASDPISPIESAIGDWAWRGVGDPLVIGQEAMILFGLNENDFSTAVGWRLDWANNTATRFALPGLVLDKKLRYSAAQNSEGLWLVGPSVALLRPDGRLLQAPLGSDSPQLLTQPDGSVLIFNDREEVGREKSSPRQILSVRTAPDGNSLLVKPLAIQSYDGRSNTNGERYREPRYGNSVQQLSDGRVLMIGGDTTNTLASIFDPASGQMTPVAPLPHPRVGAGMALLNDGRVVVVGAEYLRCSEPPSREVDVYDPKSNAWAPLPSLPLPLCGEAYGAWKAAITQASDGSLVIGGGLEPELLILTRDAKTPNGFARGWRRLATLPKPRIGGAVQALPGGQLVVAGGLHNPSQYSSGGCCDRTAGIDRISLRHVEPAFGPGGLALNGPGVALRGTRLFVAGGRRFVTTWSGQMRYSSQAEIIDLKTGLSIQFDPGPLIAGALDAAWIDDDRVLVKGRLAQSDTGFNSNLASYMPKSSAAMATLRVSTGEWTLFDKPKLDTSQLFGVREGLALLLDASGAVQTWRPGDLETRPGPDTVAGDVVAQRVLSDGRLVLAANLAPTHIVSALDPACNGAAADGCRERFVSLGPKSPAWLIEVVKFDQPDFHLARRRESSDALLNVHTTIDATGHVIRLNWAPIPGADEPGPTENQPAPGWYIERAKDALGATWEKLPLPEPWIVKSPDTPEFDAVDKACSRPYQGDHDRGKCQVLALDDPRDPTGQRSLLFLRSTVANRDNNDEVIGDTTVWWFDDAVHQWKLVFDIRGNQARYAVFDLPKTLFPGPGRLHSIGWHLEQPVLWVD